MIEINIAIQIFLKVTGKFKKVIVKRYNVEYLMSLTVLEVSDTHRQYKCGRTIYVGCL